jgi:hypothetical protein
MFGKISNHEDYSFLNYNKKKSKIIWSKAGVDLIFLFYQIKNLLGLSQCNNLI